MISDSPPGGAVARAALWMLGAVASFTMMAIAGRAVSFELDTFEIMMYRSIVGLVIVVSVLMLTGKMDQIRRSAPGLHLVRNLCHFAGQNLWFFALTAVPLAQVFALEFTSPLWVVILSPLILGERLTRLRALTAAIGFVGIMIVARPSPETLNIGTVAAASAAIGFAGAIMFTKKLTRVTTLASILFFMTALQAIFGLVCAGADGQIAWPSISTAPWLVAIGCAGLLAHFCITKALSMAPATVVVPVDFTRLPVIALIGYLFYNEPVDAFVILGSVIIFAANYLNIWTETRG